MHCPADDGIDRRAAQPFAVQRAVLPFGLELADIDRPFLIQINDREVRRIAGFEPAAGDAENLAGQYRLPTRDIKQRHLHFVIKNIQHDADEDFQRRIPERRIEELDIVLFGRQGIMMADDAVDDAFLISGLHRLNVRRRSQRQIGRASCRERV